MRTRLECWFPYLFYAFFSLAILSILLVPRYILTLDSLLVLNPKFGGHFYGLDPGIMSNMPILPLELIEQLLGKLLPGWLLQKLFLVSILFLAGIGAHRLIPLSGLGKYYAGLLYMINPFTYVRFLAGYWALLASYAIIPFAIKAFMELLESCSYESASNKRRKAIKVALLSTLVGLTQLQGLFLLFLAFLIILILRLVAQRHEQANITETGKYIGLSTGVFLALNLYWLVPLLAMPETLLHQFSSSDVFLFAPKPTFRLGILLNLASMHGFWSGGYTYATDLFPFWWLFLLPILFVAAYGFISNYSDKRVRWLVISFTVIGVVGFLLAVGAASPLTRPIFDWLWDHFLFFRGFRDSQKFLILLCLGYAYLGGLGVNSLAVTQSARSWTGGKVAAVLFTLLVLVYSFPMFGFLQQLKPTFFPQPWHEVETYLARDEDDFNVLFLPWHQYMDYSWLPNKYKRMVNPSHYFFTKPTIAGDNMEAGGIYSQSTNPISKYVELLLNKARFQGINNLGELLAPINVKYVILVHEVDYGDYDFLYQQKDLRFELELPGITLLRNLHPRARVYAVDKVTYVKSLEEYIELSQQQDVMESLYIVTPAGDSPPQQGEGTKAETEWPKFYKRSPIRYRVDEVEKQYLIFTVPQSVSTEGWKYNSQDSLKNLGFMPAFVAEGDGEVIYSRFYRVYLPSYVASLIALALAIGFYSYRKKH